MKNTFGQAVTLTLFGESHGAAVGAVLDGLAPGLPVDGDFLRRQLSRRRPTTALDTARILVNALHSDHDISGMELVDIATLHRDAANGK